MLYPLPPKCRCICKTHALFNHTQLQVSRILYQVLHCCSRDQVRAAGQLQHLAITGLTGHLASSTCGHACGTLGQPLTC